MRSAAICVRVEEQTASSKFPDSTWIKGTQKVAAQTHGSWLQIFVRMKRTDFEQWILAVALPYTSWHLLAHRPKLIRGSGIWCHLNVSNVKWWDVHRYLPLWRASLQPRLGNEIVVAPSESTVTVAMSGRRGERRRWGWRGEANKNEPKTDEEMKNWHIYITSTYIRSLMLFKVPTKPEMCSCNYTRRRRARPRKEKRKSLERDGDKMIGTKIRLPSRKMGKKWTWKM